MKIGEMLEEARVQLGLTPDQAAQKLGIGRRHWDRIVKGSSANITLRVAARAKVELGVSLDALAQSEDTFSQVAV